MKRIRKEEALVLWFQLINLAVSVVLYFLVDGGKR